MLQADSLPRAGNGCPPDPRPLEPLLLTDAGSNGGHVTGKWHEHDGSGTINGCTLEQEHWHPTHGGEQAGANRFQRGWLPALRGHHRQVWPPTLHGGDADIGSGLLC